MSEDDGAPAHRLLMEADLHPSDMWRSFSLALGPEATLAGYGWDAPPARARWSERVFVFREPEAGYAPTGCLAGWSSLTRYPKEPDVLELALGVWPDRRRLGYRRQVLDLTAAEAFRDPAADSVVMLVLDSASEHAAQCLREAEAGSPWVYSGRTWHGDPLRSFTLTREAWESAGRT
jgi:hypothetical protein